MGFEGRRKLLSAMFNNKGWMRMNVIEKQYSVAVYELQTRKEKKKKRKRNKDGRSMIFTEYKPNLSPSSPKILTLPKAII